MAAKNTTQEKIVQNMQTIPCCVQILMGTLVALFLTVGIPLIINECYKRGGYITMWGAADVLAYYGTLLGAIATVAVLATTILFTKRQLQRQSFLERSRTKWEKAESIITQALLDISPLNMHNVRKINTDASAFANICGIIFDLQSYSAKAKTSLDMIKCYINPSEYAQISDYIRELNSTIEQFLEIESELENQYMSLQVIGVANNGKIPDAALVLSFKEISEITKKIPIVHRESYQKLLNMKREAFEKIYADVDTQADQLLRLDSQR